MLGVNNSASITWCALVANWEARAVNWFYWEQFTMEFQMKQHGSHYAEVVPGVRVHYFVVPHSTQNSSCTLRNYVCSKTLGNLVWTVKRKQNYTEVRFVCPEFLRCIVQWAAP